MAIATAALAALLAPAAAAPPATVGCVPCDAAARLQDFVLSGAGELLLASASILSNQMRCERVSERR